MRRDFDQPQLCILCGGATQTAAYLGDRKVPVCPDCSPRFEDRLAEHGAPLPPPPLLYRYRARTDLVPRESGDPSFFEQFLTTDQVWASNPTEFNDPYDCRQTFDHAASPQGWETRVDEGLVGGPARLLRDAGRLPPEREEELKALGVEMKQDAKYNDPAVQADMSRGMQEFLNQARILCLCETQTNPRLWARYSDGHRGFCLEFDATVEPFCYALRVRYTKDYPTLDINAPLHLCMRTLLLTKSELWKDEEEWRRVEVLGGPPLWPIPKRALKAVIFGTRTKPDDRATITQLVTAHKPWVELREVVEVPSSYGVSTRNGSLRSVRVEDDRSGGGVSLKKRGVRGGSRYTRRLSFGVSSVCP